MTHALALYILIECFALNYKYLHVFLFLIESSWWAVTICNTHYGPDTSRGTAHKRWSASVLIQRSDFQIVAGFLFTQQTNLQQFQSTIKSNMIIF